jgi:D-serine deaminase-like pyridoxal phosphate-dependent protein
MIDFRAKGFPALDAPLDPAAVGAQGWSLFDGRFLLPTLAIRESALDHNIALMAGFCERNGISFAPHGKTTMAPEIFRRQLAAGAWAMTLATAWQANVAAHAGVPRILIANEVTDPGSISWLASTLDRGPEVWCFVDSAAGVELLSRGVAGRARRLPVLVEIGLPGGRAGVRDRESALAVARAAAMVPGLRLAGVAFFEGIVEGEPEEKLARVQALIALVREVAAAIVELVAADGGEEIVVTGGGSAYPHVVTDALVPPIPGRLPTRAVLRSGASVTHDHGGYDPVSPFGSNGIPGWPRLRPALEVWAPVLSVPEPGRIIAGAGKRDLSHDGPPPAVLATRRADGVRRPVTGDELVITRLNDQHAYITPAPGQELAVGDLVAIAVRHACMGMDRWHWAPLVADDDRVTAAIELIF